MNIIKTLGVRIKVHSDNQGSDNRECTVQYKQVFFFYRKSMQEWGGKTGTFQFKEERTGNDRFIILQFKEGKHSAPQTTLIKPPT